MHDPERREEYREAARQRGSKGARAKAQNRVKRAAALSLATTGDIRRLLEQTAAEVRGSGGDVCTRAHATVRICATALDALKTLDLEKQVDELRQLIEARTAPGGRA